MAYINNMEELKEKAIHVYERMVCDFPHYTVPQRHSITLENLDLEPLTFAYHSSVIGFVDEHKELFVIPNLKGIQKLLIQNGYRKAYFFVPFSDWSYPVIYKEKWRDLWRAKNSEKK